MSELNTMSIKMTALVSLVHFSLLICGLGKTAVAMSLPDGEKISEVCTGRLHTCVRVGSRLKCFGRAIDGQLGYESRSMIGRNKLEMGDLLGYVDVGGPIASVACGGDVTCVVMESDRSLKCFGDNEDGNLGIDTDKPVGREPGEMGENLATVNLGALKVNKVAVGNRHTCVLLEDGSVRCWGSNSLGRKGAGDTNRNDPNIVNVNFGSNQTAIDIAASGSHTCIITSEKLIKCWGKNDKGQLGIGSTASRGTRDTHMGDALTPVDVGASLGDVEPVSIVCGGASVSGGHTCVLFSNHKVKCWGDNGDGQIAAGEFSTVGSGRTNQGRMGDTLPFLEFHGQNITHIAAGSKHTCVRTTSGQLYCFGDGFQGALGLESRLDVGKNLEEFLQLPNVDLGRDVSVLTVSAGDRHTCATVLVRNETTTQLKCWGDGGSGQLGLGSSKDRGRDDGTMGDVLPFVEILPNNRRIQFIHHSSQGHHKCVVLDSHQVKCWGRNREGQLGLGTSENSRGDSVNEMGDSLSYVFLGDGIQVSKVYTGRFHSCAVLVGGGVKCWGANKMGQLGVGDRSTRGERADQMGASLSRAMFQYANHEVTSMALGEDHTCALLNSREVVCFGSNQFGQLGISPSVELVGANPFDKLIPANLTDLVMDITAGAKFTCFHFEQGSVGCVGDNSVGQLGFQPASARKLSGRVASTHRLLLSSTMGRVDFGPNGTVKTMCSGEQHSCAITTLGKVLCWGSNSNGQLGIGESGTLSRGTAPDHFGVNFTAVDLGSFIVEDDSQLGCGLRHTCLLTSVNGEVLCWGSNSKGQLGQTDTRNRVDTQDKLAPVRVVLTRDDGEEVVGVSVASDYTCVMLSSGLLTCFGSGNEGELGGSRDQRVKQSPRTRANAGLVNLGSDCPKGARNTGSGCRSCSSGEFANDQGMQGCSLCGVGSYQNLKNAASCKACAAGDFNDELGQSLCKVCPLGGFVPLDEVNPRSSCVRCGLGQFQDKYGQSSCQDCRPGTFADVTGLVTCKSCLPGQHQPNPGAIECISCLSGHYSNSSATVCSKCEPGSFQQAEGAGHCNLCPEGFVQPEEGRTECEPCTIGFAQPKRGQTKCIGCGPGFVQSAIGRAVCGECGIGEYSSFPSTDGNRICTQCPPERRATRQPRSTSANDCIAEAGVYFDSITNKAEPCPQGADCELGTTLSTMKLKPGFWRVSSETSFIQECASSEICVGKDAGNFTGSVFDSTKYCRDGHVGVLCRECVEGFAKNAGSRSLCYQCTAEALERDTQNGRLALGIIIAVVVLLTIVCLVFGFRGTTQKALDEKAAKAAVTLEDQLKKYEDESAKQSGKEGTPNPTVLSAEIAQEQDESVSDDQDGFFEEPDMDTDDDEPLIANRQYDQEVPGIVEDDQEQEIPADVPLLHNNESELQDMNVGGTGVDKHDAKSNADARNGLKQQGKAEELKVNKNERTEDELEAGLEARQPKKALPERKKSSLVQLLRLNRKGTSGLSNMKPVRVNKFGRAFVHVTVNSKHFFSDHAAKFKILVGYLQVLSAYLIVFGKESFPSFEDELAALQQIVSLAGLDVFEASASIGCYLSWDHHDKVVLFSIAPLVLVMFIAIVVLVARLTMNKVGAGMVAERGVILIVLVLFLVYPSVNKTIFEMFVCDPYVNESVLRVDTSIGCDSERHDAIISFTMVMIAVYTVGVPLFFVYLLWRGIANGFLVRHFKPKYSYWEALELIRKLFQAALIVFYFDRQRGQIIISMVLASFFGLVYVVLRPYKKKSDNLLALISQICLFFICVLADFTFGTRGKFEGSSTAIDVSGGQVVEEYDVPWALLLLVMMITPAMFVFQMVHAGVRHVHKRKTKQTKQPSKTSGERQVYRVVKAKDLPEDDVTEKPIGVNELDKV